MASRVKQDLSRLNINQLQQLTKKSYRQVKEALDDKGIRPEEISGELRYIPNEALEAIYQPKEFADTDGINPLLQKARLDRARADREIFDLDIERGKYREAEEVDREWAQIIGAVRAKLLSLPTKLAPRLANSSEVRECGRLVDRAVREALLELSRGEVEPDNPPSDVEIVLPEPA